MLSFFMTPHIHLSILISLHPVSFLALSLLPMSLHCTSMLVLSLFCISSPLALRASFCHTTLHCTSSNFPMLHSTYVLSPYPYLHSPPPLQVLEVVHLIPFFPGLIFSLFVDLPFPLVRTYIPSTVCLVYWLSFPSRPALFSTILDILSYQLHYRHTVSRSLQTPLTLVPTSSLSLSVRPLLEQEWAWCWSLMEPNIHPEVATFFSSASHPCLTFSVHILYRSDVLFHLLIKIQRTFSIKIAKAARNVLSMGGLVE